MRRKKKQPRQRQKKNRQQLTYPDPETWRKIVAQRDQILKRFLYGIAEGNPGVVDNLVNEYGVYQVRYVLENFKKHARPSFLVDEAAVYCHYRWLFAQFGGDRPFLSKQGYDAVVQAEIHDPEQVQRMILGSSGLIRQCISS